MSFNYDRILDVVLTAVLLLASGMQLVVLLRKVGRMAPTHMSARWCAAAGTIGLALRALHVMLTTPAPAIMQARKRMGIEAVLRKEFGREIVLPGRAALRAQRRSTAIYRPQ